MTPVNKAQQVTNVGLYVLPIVIGNLVPLVTLPVFTAFLSTEDFGAMALANAYAVVVGGVAAVGLPIAFERNFFEHRESGPRSRLLYSVILFSTLSFAACGLATWWFRAPITQWLVGDLGYQQVVVWSFCSTALVGLKTYYLAYLRNSEQAGAFSTYTIAERLLAAVFTLVLVAWFQVGVMGLVVGQLLATVAVLIVLVVHFVRMHPPAFDGRLLAAALKLGFPLMPRILFGVIGNNFDKYLIREIGSLGGVGVYTVGQRVANIAFTYLSALQNVFGPQVYSRMFSGAPEAGRSIGAYLTPFAYVSAVLGFLIAVFSEEILMVLVQPEFYGAVPVVTILAIGAGLQFFGKLPQIAFSGKTYLISVLAAVTTAISMALGLAGIWLFGTIGVAWAALLTTAISLSLSFVVGQRCFRIEWQSRRMIAIFGLFVVSALITIVLRDLDVTYVVRLAAKLMSVVAFIALGAKLDVITVQNLVLARDIVLRRRTAF